VKGSINSPSPSKRNSKNLSSKKKEKTGRIISRPSQVEVVVEPLEPEALLLNENPLSQENIQLSDDRIEDHKQSLYEMHNDSIVTISSIKEFDKEKDWLTK
jgi:hypothetical protein